MNNRIYFAVAILIIVLTGSLLALLFLDVNKKQISEPVIPDTIQSDKKVETLKTVNTANWKIYQNETFGYELKYPSAWVIGTTFGADPYTFSAPNFSPANGFSDELKVIPSFSVSSIHKIAEGETLETDVPLGNRDGRIVEKKMIKIDGRDALLVEYFKTGYGDPNGKVGRVQQQIKVIDAGVAYHLEMQEYYKEEKLLESSAAWESNAIFQAILDSFHFFENNKVNITLTGEIDKNVLYTNKNFGFSVILPDAWEKYEVSVQNDKGDSKHTYIYFMMPTADKGWGGSFDKNTNKVIPGLADIFAITATDLATWKKEAESKECLENPNPSCPDTASIIGENEEYVFSASYGNGVLPGDVAKFIEGSSAAEFLAGKFKIL